MKMLAPAVARGEISARGEPTANNKQLVLGEAGSGSQSQKAAKRRERESREEDSRSCASSRASSALTATTQATTSSSSGQASSATTTTTSSSEQSVASGETLIKTRDRVLVAASRPARRERRMDDSYLHHQEEEEEEEEDVEGKRVESQQNSAKRYRNSPFGLRRHYLTMPDDETSNSGAGVASSTIKGGLKFTTDEEDDESDLNVSDREHRKQLGKKTGNNTLYGKHHFQRQAPYLNAANLMDYGAANSNATNQWRHHHHLTTTTSQPKSTAGLSSDDHLNHFNEHTDGDLGLDAEKCNAKMSDIERGHNRYLAHTGGGGGSKNNQIQGDLHKLKLDELVEPREEANSLLVRFSSIMYATFLVILGCILHVSELRQKSKNSSDHIYTTIVALIGILWLLFLQADLQRYKRYATKYILIETIFNDHRQKSIDELQRQRQKEDPSGRSTSSSAASLVNDRMSMNTEVIFKKTAYKMYQQRAAMGANMNPHRHRSMSHLPQGVLDQHRRGGGGHQDDMLSPDQLVPAYKFLHGKMGANFYLKCGMAAFCFGHVIHEGLRFGQQVYFFGTANVHCRDSAALVAHLITPLYSFYQLFMMFKYSNLVINRHKVLARFGLMHIIGTSVTFWFRTILEEAFEDFVHKMDYFKTNKPQLNLTFGGINPSESNLMSLITSTFITNSTQPPNPTSVQDGLLFNNSTNMAQSLLTLMSSPISATITPQLVRHLPDSYACAQNTLLTTKSMNALPYLYPFTIEYNLLLAATFLSLYFNIGKVGHSTGSVCRPSLINYSQLIKQHQQSSNSSHASQVHGESSDNSSAVRRAGGGGGDGHDSIEKDYIGEYKSNFVVNADCHSANKGLFCGFFVLLVTLVTIVIFFVTINKPTHIQLGIKINLIQEATLTTLILLVTLAGFKQVVKLNRNPYLRDKVTTDDVLMLIPLPFFFIHSLLSFRAETASMSASNSLSSLSSILLQRNNVNHYDNLMTATAAATTTTTTQTNSNLQSILLNTNSNIINNTHHKSSKLNNLLGSHTNGTNGRLLVEESFISNMNNNNNSNSKNGSRIMSNGGNNSNIVINNIGGGGGGGGSGDGGRNGGSGSINSNNNSNGGSISSQIDHFKLITVALNIIVMIEVLVQTNFIIDGMRRCSESRYLRFKKPGRELITFAILLNITYWIVATFETKSVEQYKTEIEYYGPLPYMFISHTTLPVMLFYRYHSSVCLAEMWNRAYKPPKKR